MTLAVDIRVLGVPELEKELRRLEDKTQRKIVRQALRKSAKRTKDRIIDNLSGEKVQVRTGQLRQAFKDAPIRGTTRRGFTRVGVVFPERGALGIDAKDKHYYPTAVEYGHGTVPPHPFLRPAIDEHKQSEFDRIGKDIGKAIEREAGK